MLLIMDIYKIYFVMEMNNWWNKNVVMIMVWKKFDCCKILKKEFRIFCFNFDEIIYKLREII